MKTVLDNSNGFFTMESDTSTGKLGRTPLLAHCSGGHFSVDSLSLLINRGAHISARDLNGWTCLHYAFLSNWDMDVSSGDRVRLAPTKQVALAYLLSHGADPFAVEDRGQSVSGYAYRLQHSEYADPMETSYKGDVWDAVLADFGIDVAENRRQSGSRRVARYVKRYSRKDFEKLWEGKEHLCPYYDDKDFGSSDDGSSEGASDVSPDSDDGTPDLDDGRLDSDDGTSDSDDDGGGML